MKVNENSTLNAQIMVKDNLKDSNGLETGQTIDVQIMYLNATIDAANGNINISASTNNKELVIANADYVKSQYAEFEALVKTRANNLGFVIF